MKIQFITNVLTPYRIYFFDILNSVLENRGGMLEVLVMMKPDHNMYWNYYDYERRYTKLLPVKYIKDKSDYFFNFKLSEFIQDFKPNVIVGCGAYWYPTILSALKYCKKNNIKFIYWSESNKIKFIDKKGLKYQFRESIRKYSYKRMDGFIYPGKHALELIKDYNQNPTFLFQLPNLVNSDKYAFFDEQKEKLRDELGIAKEKLALFCPARLSQEKGIIPFLEIYAKSELKEYSQIYIAGKGPDEKLIKNYISAHNLNVNLLGYVTEEIMIKYYHACDFFLLPSLSDPSPLSCIEALWSGLPLILSSSVGNLPEALIDGENGFSFNYLNDNETIHMLNQLPNLFNSEWYIRAKEKCLKLAKLNFDPQQKTAELIEKLNGI